MLSFTVAKNEHGSCLVVFGKLKCKAFTDARTARRLACKLNGYPAPGKYVELAEVVRLLLPEGSSHKLRHLAASAIVTEKVSAPKSNVEVAADALWKRVLACSGE